VNSDDEASIDAGPDAGLDVGDYCRRVEEHLARTNEGQIIRITGTSFAMVREWARRGIPLSVVLYGIDRKAERHRTGRAKRALRLEFCEPDVVASYEQWRRAVGVRAPADATTAPLGGDGEAPAGRDLDVRAERRQPSLSRHLDRVADRLVRAAGRLETPVALRETLAAALEACVDAKAQVRHARGAAREALSERLASIDRRMLEVARLACGPDLPEVEREATAELATYKGRLAPDVWQRSVEASVDRLLRERYGLPTIDPARI
jgi:hypothetical protein